MSEQAATPQRPDTKDPRVWKTYWKAQGFSWRTEPEIDEERQRYLDERRKITADIEKGVYPFKDIKLSRADMEWLLATHENGRGPVDWSDLGQRKREGLDLRGADLCKAVLSDLPLAGVHGGLTGTVWLSSTPEQDNMAAVQLENTILINACLQNARLNRANLKGANLFQTHLENAELNHVHMESASLLDAHVERAQLRYAHLEEVDLRNGHLEGADLRRAFFNSATRLDNITLGVQESDFTSLADISWEGVNLAIIDWSPIKELDFEHLIQQKDYRGEKRLNEYKRFVRANRQLAVALQSQGLYEDASRFAYRAQKLQRVVLRHQKRFGQYLFSGFLDLLAGYGYRPGRSAIWYLIIIVGFALAYHFLGGLSLYPPDAFVFSIMSFHGRGFFPALSQETNLHNPLVMLAALEAIIGLLIEISFIATFTQRFFGR